MKVHEILSESKHKQKLEPVKPRNFVAKNAMKTTSGAGAHKDKKKAAKQGEVKHKKQLAMEAGYYGRRNREDDEGWGSSYDRRQQSQMDYDKRSFKRAELQHELGHETNNLQVVINGKPWKVFPGRGRADSPEEFKFLQSMKAWAAKKSAQTGKKWEVYLTGANPTESVKEDAGFQALDAWKKEVLQAYPQYAGKIKFLGRDGQVSAEIPGLDRSFGVFDLDTETGEVLGESATAGATSAGNIASVANPHVAIGKDRGKKSYTGSPGKSGTKAPAVPKAVQAKNADGTAKNALDLKGTSVFGGALKR